ncbi:hypothetical protein PI124_g17128 [Phytophthora idaei]|nr:hypothetical protein PI124_g17128 [Phytophthora idaei]
MVLKKFYKDQSGVNRDTTLPPVRLKDGSEGHLIESIIDHRVTKKGIEECKCKWVGRNDDIWEPTANLLSEESKETMLTELEIHEQASFAAALALTSLQSTPEHIMFPVLQYD